MLTCFSTGVVFPLPVDDLRLNAWETSKNELFR